MMHFRATLRSSEIEGSAYLRGPEVRERCSLAQGARSFPWEAS